MTALEEFYQDFDPVVAEPEFSNDWNTDVPLASPNGQHASSTGKNVANNAGTRKWPIHWASEFLTPQEPIKWVVEGVLSEASLNIIFGEPGSKKTWTMLDLAVAVANGEPTWLGRNITQGTVLIVDEESGNKLLGDRLYLTQRGHNVQCEIPIAIITMNGINLRKQEHLQMLHDVALEVQPILIIVDTLQDTSGGADENAVNEMLPVLVGLRRIAEKTSAATLVAHHPNRTGSYRGSSAIKGKCDTLIKVESKDGEQLVKFTSEKVRNGAPFTLEARAFWSPGMFNLSVAQTQATETPTTQSEIRRKVTGILSQGEQGFNALYSVVGGNRGQFKGELANMVIDGEITVHDGKRNSTIYAISNTTDTN